MDRRRGKPRIRGALVALASLLWCGGCSGTFPFSSDDEDPYLEAGQDLIEGELADLIDLGPLVAECQGEDLGPGDTFSCTGSAMSPDANDFAPIQFVGTIDANGQDVDIRSTNLLLADQVAEIESFAASLIDTEIGRLIRPEDFECADTSIVVAEGETVDCVVSDASGTVYSATITVDDIETLSITVSVGDAIG